MRPCFVTGPASQIASWLVPRLLERGWEPHLVSRGRARPDDGAAVHWHGVDLADPSHALPAVTADVLFHTARLDLLPAWIERFAERGVGRVIAFGTTSIFTKATSATASERAVVAAIARAEEDLADACRRAHIRHTLFRPTLIYGGRFGDRNVSDIARVIARLGFFPLLGRADGLRQPVHAADLAAACLLACDCTAAFDRAYDLAGGETLTYRAMVERIFAAMGRQPRLVPVPAWLFATAVAIARRHPRWRHLTADMATRMGRDMAFDDGRAAADFGYAPRRFAPVIAI